MRRALTSLVLLAFAVPAAAAEKVEPQPTYWQTLPGVGYVDFDTDRNPVFHTESGFYFAKSGQLVKRPEHATGSAIYCDRSGRLWVLNYHKDCAYYGGTGKWEQIDRRPVKLFDDRSGRAFLFDGKSVHVLADGKWTAQDICEKRHGEDVHFVESGKRVWLWGSREKPGGRDGMLGVWSFADGKWTHHTAKTGLPFDSVRWLHPLADGRFVVIEDRVGKEPTSRVRTWHPDRALKDDERGKWEAKPHGPSDPLTGTDGTLYLADNLRNSGVTAISPKGDVSLTEYKDWYERRLLQARLHGRYVVFGALGEKPLALPAGDGEFIGADRDGRHYFVRGGEDRHYHKKAVVTVVWPKHEKPGELLHVEKEKMPMTRVVKDDAGKIWAEPDYGGGLFQWHGGKWLETPVAPLYHPAWTARPASPWNEWTWNASHLFRLHGKGGSVLAVRVRDVYQQDEPPTPDGSPPRPIVDRAFPHPAPAPGVPAAGEKPKYWLEAFLFSGGKWVGPLDVKKLLADHAATLLTDFPTTSGNAGFFAFANDGARLWAAFDGKVLTAAKDGKVTESEWPREKPKRPLPFVTLCTFADKKVVLAGEYGDAHELKLADGKVAASKYTLPTGVVRNAVSVTNWRLAKDGTFWLWTAGLDGTRAQVWHFREEKWAEQKGVGSPLYEDADGGLVCLAEPRWAYRHHLMVVRGAETKELLFPREEWQFGFTDVPKDAHLWAVGDALLFVDASGAKPVVRWRLLSGGFVPGFVPAVADGKGTVLLGALRGVLK